MNGIRLIMELSSTETDDVLRLIRRGLKATDFEGDQKESYAWIRRRLPELERSVIDATKKLVVKKTDRIEAAEVGIRRILDGGMARAVDWVIQEERMDRMHDGMSGMLPDRDEVTACLETVGNWASDVTGFVYELDLVECKL